MKTFYRFLTLVGIRVISLLFPKTNTEVQRYSSMIQLLIIEMHHSFDERVKFGRKNGAL